MVRLTDKQVQKKKDFINDYIKASNAAEASKMDSNANVSSKNIATLSAEIHKDFNIQINRGLIYDRILNKSGKYTADEYLRQLEVHEIYTHDETSLMPYCVSISMYPFLISGLKGFGGEAGAPKHLSSFNGGFVNLIFAVASQFAGAVATVEYLMYFDHFARKEYGDDYLDTHRYIITQELQQVVYALNQPAAARGYQSVFWNISIYDKPYFEAMFGGFTFPDFSRPSWESLDKLQRFFMRWFNEERTKAVLTFPVVTAAVLNDGKDFVDKEYKQFLAQELSEGNSFFIFNSDNASALSSCCRLKNDVSDQMNDFSYSLGAGGVMTGSMNVITLNMNRLVQDCRDLRTEVQKIHRYQLAFKELFEEYQAAGMLPVYDTGFISLEKQYLTIGINGLVEAAEYLGFEISNNEPYKNWVAEQLKIISDENKVASKIYNCKFNTEFVPAENLGKKFAEWDKKDGYKVNRDIYNSYLYKVEDESISILDKFSLHGKDTSKFLDGGSAYHCNLESYPTAETFEKLMKVAIVEGCEYFCFNVKVTVCEDCGYIDKRTNYVCTKCASKNISWATRIIGYLKKIKDFSLARQNEAEMRFYDKKVS